MTEFEETGNDTIVEVRFEVTCLPWPGLKRHVVTDAIDRGRFEEIGCQKIVVTRFEETG